MKKLSAVLLVFILVFCGSAFAQANGSPRVSVAVLGNLGFEKALNAQLLAVLSNNDGIEIVERADLSTIFNEWSTQLVFSKFREDSKLLGLDYIVLISLSEIKDKAVLRILNARSGEQLKTRIISGLKNKVLSRSFIESVAELLAETIEEADQPQGPAIAFAFQSLSSGSRALFVDLLKELERNKLSVLNREQIRNSIDEHLLQQNGFAHVSLDNLPLKGADILIRVKESRAWGGKFSLRMYAVCTKSAERLSTQVFDVRHEAAPSVAQWIGEVLKLDC